MAMLSGQIAAGQDVYLPLVPAAHNPRPAAEFYRLWQAHPGQQRKYMHWDERLAQAAQAHAEDIQRIRLSGQSILGRNLHLGLDGSTANERVRRADYRLPAVGYADVGNQVESISVRNHAVIGVAGVLQKLIASPGHRVHILGEIAFFAGQTQVGVGFCPPVSWVVISAHPEGWQGEGWASAAGLLLLLPAWAEGDEESRQ